MQIRKKKIGKKGSLFDLIYIVPLIFIMVLIMFFVHRAWSEMSPQLAAEPDFSGPEGKAAMQTATETINGFDILIPFIFIFFILIMVIMAFYVQTSPVFMFIGIFILAISLTLAVAFKDIFKDISGDSEFANETATYVASSYIMNHLPAMIAVAGLILFIALYGKWGRPR
jgi:hypothetical protein